MRRIIEEGELVRTNGWLAVFAGDCLCRELEKCQQGDCWGKAVFLGKNFPECTYELKPPSRTGYRLPEEQVVALSSFANSQLEVPNGFRSPKEIDSGKTDKLPQGRVLIDKNNGHPLFIIYLSFSVNLKEELSLFVWKIGRSRPEEIAFPRALLDTRLTLSCDQLGLLVNSFQGRF